MSEYTSTREGFQRSMQMSLDGPATETEAEAYVAATSMPNIVRIMNGKQSDYAGCVKELVEFRAKTSEEKCQIEEFLRDGDQLAARMTGTLKFEGQEIAYESFMFITVDEESGKISHFIERTVSGPVGKAPDQGVNM